MQALSGPDWSGRLARVQSALASRNLDTLVISSLVNIKYLTGFAGTAGLLLVTPEDVSLVVDGRYALGAREGQAAGAVAPVTLVTVAVRYDATLMDWLSARARRRVGFEAEHVTVAQLSAWQRGASGVEFVPTQRVVEDGRLVKDAWERDVFRRAGAALDAVAMRLGEFVRSGRTERQVAEAIERGLTEAGFSAPSFPTIVASGPNSARPHATPTDRRLVPGDLVVLDFGGVLDGYCVDLTRAAAVAPVPDRARGLYEAVLAAQSAALEVVKPGAEVSAIDAAARAALDARGLGEAFLHSTGHGLGLEIHEAPRLARADTEAPGVIEAGMVFTIEPGAYVEGVGGVRLEDDVLVTTGGYDLLTRAPRDLVIVA